ncbi:MAG: cell division protein FtsB [Acidiferrobacterales bacterium]
MRVLRYLLIGLLLALQYPLWFGHGNALAIWRLHQQAQTQGTENTRLRERNQALVAEVMDLKHGLEAIEERARVELGMVKQGETFFHVVEDPASHDARP